MSVAGVVLFYSRYSPLSRHLLEQIHSSPHFGFLRQVCLDHPELRRKTPIRNVPTILVVFQNGQRQMITGFETLNWVKNVEQSLQPPPQPLPVRERKVHFEDDVSEISELGSESEAEDSEDEHPPSPKKESKEELIRRMKGESQPSTEITIESPGVELPDEKETLIRQMRGESGMAPPPIPREDRRHLIPSDEAMLGGRVSRKLDATTISQKVQEMKADREEADLSLAEQMKRKQERREARLHRHQESQQRKKIASEVVDPQLAQHPRDRRRKTRKHPKNPPPPS